MPLFVFYLSHRLVWVCEIELSYMGKNNGNCDLVVRNYAAQTVCKDYISADNIGKQRDVGLISKPFEHKIVIVGT